VRSWPSRSNSFCSSGRCSTWMRPLTLKTTTLPSTALSIFNVITQHPSSYVCMMNLERSGTRPTRASSSALPAPQHRLRGRGYLTRLEAILLLQLLQRCRGSECLHTNDVARRADVALPSESGSLLHGDAGFHGRGQHAVSVRLRLVVEDLPRRHRNHTRAD